MGFKQIISSMNPYQDFGILIRQVADIVVIFIACFLSEIFISQESNITALLIQTFSLFLLFCLIFIPIFYLKGIYTYGRNLSVNKKLYKLIESSLLAAFILLIVFSIFKIYLNLSFTFSDLLISDLSVAWLLIFLGSIFSRIWLYSYINVNIDPIKQFDDNSKILVIGGGGYIGSSVVKQLLDLNYKVRVLDIFLFGEEPISASKNHPNLEIMRGDFRKVDDLVQAVVLAINKSDAAGRTYYVTDGIKYSIAEIEQAIYRAWGRKMPAWKTPHMLLSVTAGLAGVLTQIFMLIGLKRGSAGGISGRTYRNLVTDNLFSNEQICGELGYKPGCNFYEALPQIVESMDREAWLKERE